MRTVDGAREVTPETLGVARFRAVVELGADRAGELVHDRDRVHERERADAGADEPGGLVQELEVGLDLARRPRTLHLHRDAFAVRQHGSVHLPDGRRGDGLQLELEEGTIERQPELGLEHLLDLAGGERADVVLERAELEDDVRRHDVGAGRQQLAELHEGRARARRAWRADAGHAPSPGRRPSPPP